MTSVAAANASSSQTAAGLDTSHAAATLAWLADHNNMEARVIEQLVGLKPRVTASTGGGMLSGQWDAQVACWFAIGGLVHYSTATQDGHYTIPHA